MILTFLKNKNDSKSCELHLLTYNYIKYSIVFKQLDTSCNGGWKLNKYYVQFEGWYYSL